MVLIRVLQTHVWVECSGGIATLYPRLLITLCVPCFARFYEQIFTPSDLASVGLVPLFYGDSLLRQKNIKTGFKVGCCFNEGLIRVLQTLDLVGVVCRAGGIASLYPRLLIMLCVPCFARFYKQIFTPSDLAVLGLVPLY